jgi:hypothetical protein
MKYKSIKWTRQDLKFKLRNWVITRMNVWNVSQ